MAYEQACDFFPLLILGVAVLHAQGPTTIRGGERGAERVPQGRRARHYWWSGLGVQVVYGGYDHYAIEVEGCEVHFVPVSRLEALLRLID
ncbi:MAG: hypothetical protein JSR80_06245 [Verrucomicrobia bacterium]|nr:hypothetical protein [Verrucomicrobiota bacterium]